MSVHEEMTAVSPDDSNNETIETIIATPCSSAPYPDSVIASCIISKSPPTKIVNSVVTTKTTTDAEGNMKKLKTTTTTTLRTTTTVRRVCVMASKGPDGQTIMTEVPADIAGAPPQQLMLSGEEGDQGGLNLSQGGAIMKFGEGDSKIEPNSEMFRLTQVSGDAPEGMTEPTKITQLTFMKPQTTTSEVIEFQDNDNSEELPEQMTGKADEKVSVSRTTKTIRKLVTTSVSAVFASRHTNSPHPLKGTRVVSSGVDTLDSLSRSNDGKTFFANNYEYVNEDNSALLALRECERQFAARLALTSSGGDSEKMNSITIFDPSIAKEGSFGLEDNAATGPRFLFDGLPLYQGYGLIGQHEKQTNASGSLSILPASATSTSIMGVTPINQLDVGSLTRMLEEATCVSLLSTDFNKLFDDLVTRKPGKSDFDVPCTPPNVDKTNVTPHSPALSVKFFDKENDEISEDGDEKEVKNQAYGYRNKFLNHLGAKSGPCRVAWSEMPEVQTGNILSSMSQHEIQLQEAMFEVITSEASYYRSLQVLINHFYGAPEFDCSRAPQTVGPTEVENEPSSVETASLASTSTSFVGVNSTELKKTPSLTLKDSTVLRSLRAGSVALENQNNVQTKPVISPTEKHHLFSNVLLVCMASEGFLRDLEMRWSEKRPLLNEVCDLIVKHAGGLQFEPYLTYLRNQTYQLSALRRLNQREDFQKAISRLHSHPSLGKNHLDSFLALPMQRLTRLKLLVEVIQKLQSSVIKDAEETPISGSTETMTPASERSRRMTVTMEQQENVSIALRELKRLLAESESAKQLMDEKARLLTLSNSLEFPENVKRITISDKRLVKEGELKSAVSDGKATVLLKKLGRRKPETFYLLLFEDLLMVTKRKKNDRYIVQDYCLRENVYVTIKQSLDSAPTSNHLNSIPRSQTMSVTGNRMKRFRKGGRNHTTSPEVPEVLFKQPDCESLSTDSSRNAIHICGIEGSPPPLSDTNSASDSPHVGSPANNGGILPPINLRRSGSNISSKSVPTCSTTIQRDLPFFLFVSLTESHNGVCSDLCFAPSDYNEYGEWYRALCAKTANIEWSKPAAL